MSHCGADRTRDSIPFPKSLLRALNDVRRIWLTTSCARHFR
jgi:hypothetical protein